LSERAAVAWSGGKDSALALYEVASSGELEVDCLLTTLTEDYGRVTMHGVRAELLELQAEALGYKLERVYIPANASNQVYEERMREALTRLLHRGVRRHVFGDIFLEDVRRYREEMLARLDIRGVWPLWGRDTGELARRFVALGFRAVVCCVDLEQLGPSYLGREFDTSFLQKLPAAVDPCGERGEFHTFVYDGPGFKRRISFRRGEMVLRDNRFYYIDLLPL
jgi:uncharacterized protein (TIGR00290 family)